MKLFNNLLKHELISGSFFIFIGSMISNVLAFLLNLFLARNLSYSDYAIFASLLSVITLAAIPAGSINTIIVKFATDLFAKQENDRLKTLYLMFFKLILGICVSIIIIFLVTAIPIQNFLHLDNVWYVIVVGLTISAFYLNVLNTAFLQSLLKFGFISFLSALGGVVKLIFGVALIILGYRAFGGLWAIFFMTFATYAAGFIPLKKIIQSRSSDKVIPMDINKIFKYAVPTFVTVLFLTSFTSSDVILVKHFFNPHLAGFYAGLSLIGKVIFYFTIPIPMVMFPLLIKRHSKGENYVNLFYLALILVLLPSFAITVFYFVFPNFVINLFLGGRDYIYIAKYLGIFGFYLTVFSLVNVCVNFFLSLNKTNISIPVAIAAISQIILIYLFHNSFYEVISASLIVSIILLIVLLFLFFKNYGNVQKIKETVAFLNNPNL